MMHDLRRAIWITVLFASPLLAQNQVGNLTVISLPPGTAITLEGEYELAGVTPVTFNQRLQGVYKLTAYREGYENYETKLMLSTDDPYQIDFEMVPKTRAKAAIRSLIIPGWGQMYGGQKFRGALYTSAAVLSLISVFVADQRFRDKRDEYNHAVSRYDQVRSIDEKRNLKPYLDSAQEDAYDAETARQVTIGIAAFVWAFNVIDAVVFFPDRRYSVGGPLSMSLETDSDFGGLGLRFAINF